MSLVCVEKEVGLGLRTCSNHGDRKPISRRSFISQIITQRSHKTLRKTNSPKIHGSSDPQPPSSTSPPNPPPISYPSPQSLSPTLLPPHSHSHPSSRSIARPTLLERHFSYLIDD